MSLHLLKQHHNQFHKGKEFNDELYTKNAAHRNIKERKELETRIFEEQERREKAKEKELLALKNDLKSLKEDISTALKSEISEVAKERNDNLKAMDTKITEMKNIINSTLSNKAEHRKWVEDHEKVQDDQYESLKVYMSEILTKYKNDLDSRFSNIDNRKDTEKADLNAEISAQNNVLSNHKKKIDQLQNQLSTAQDKLEKKDKELAEAESKIKSMEDSHLKELSSMGIEKDQFIVLKKRNDGLEKQNTEFSDKIKDLEKENLKFKNDLKGAQGANNVKIDDLEDQLKARTTEIDSLKAEALKLKGEKKNAETEIKKLQLKIDQLELDLKNAKKNAVSSENQAKELQDKLNNESNKKSGGNGGSGIIINESVEKQAKDPSKSKTEKVKKYLADESKNQNSEHPNNANPYETKFKHNQDSFKNLEGKVVTESNQFEKDTIQKQLNDKSKNTVTDLDESQIKQVKDGIGMKYLA